LDCADNGSDIGSDNGSLVHHYHNPQTDAFTLRCVREASSWARVQLESQVGRGLMSSPYSTGEMHT
jgi:hypothetical protein